MDNSSQPNQASSLTMSQKAMGFISSNFYALLAVALFASLLMYLIHRTNASYVTNSIKYGAQGPQADNANIVDIMYFYTEWCPHCKNARPEWENFKQIYHGKSIKNMKIKCTEGNCDDDEAMADKYNVEAYPTIKLVKNNTVYEYDAKPNVDTLGQFLDSVL